MRLRLFPLLLLGAVAVHVGGAPAQVASGTFSVRINLTSQVNRQSACATLSGVTARVSCLTSATPRFDVPGRTDVSQVPGLQLETAASTPSEVNVSGLGATAAGPQDGSGGFTETELGSGAATDADEDQRRRKGAAFTAPASSPPIQEIEVSF